MADNIEREFKVIDSYSKIRDLKYVRKHGFFDLPLCVEEKVDGSQFSFAKINGHLYVRSKGREFDVNDPDGLFKGACETVKNISHLLREKWIYRGEVIQKPRHNVITYDRVPNGNIILFDVHIPENREKLSSQEKREEACRLGLECVQTLGYFEKGELSDEIVEELLQSKSQLGDVQIEGIVIKQVEKDFSRILFDPASKKELMCKIVSDEFKEVAQRKKTTKHKIERSGEIISDIAEKYGTDPRFRKAFQHLKEDGKLTGERSDIGLLCKEIVRDIWDECHQEIAEDLVNFYKKSINKKILADVPSWWSTLED